MPEPGSDVFRNSADLPVKEESQDTVTKPMLYMTDDEIYNRGQLPDGLQTDGTHPRHWGESCVAHEDNQTEIRHNPGFGPTMHEWGQGQLHSGSKKGPVVKSQKQALAIAFSEKGK